MVKKLIEAFPAFEIKQQEENYCGPCSLTYCLALMGINKTEWECAHASGAMSFVGEIVVEYIGTLPNMLVRAARRFGVWGETCVYEDDEEDNLIQDLRDHIEEGCGAILLVDSGHWVSVVAYDRKSKKFIINDPANEDEVLQKVAEEELLEWSYNSEETLEIGGFLVVYIGDYDLEEA